MRPGDSVPKFDQIREVDDPDSAVMTEATGTAGQDDPADASDAGESHILSEKLPGQPPVDEKPPVEAESPKAESAFADSHVFTPMIPHHSDGSTDVLVRGEEGRLDDDSAETEPMFIAPAPTPPASVPAGEVFPSSEQTPTFSEAAEDSGVHPGVEPAPLSPSSPKTTSASSGAAQPAAPTKVPLLLIILLSYASVVTIALIYLLLTQGNRAIRHQLENIRDPMDEEGTVRIFERSVELPPGHELALNESRRFGNILVEPLRITREPLEYVHFSDPTRKRAPSEPVLKLWLRLTNVSDDQTIAPLDALLVFKREMNTAGELVANTFVSPRENQPDDPIVFTYPTPQYGEWDLKDQHLGLELKPGESVTTFIPSDTEGMDQLSGPLRWRFQLRKGYSSRGNGVTTLVDVLFSRDDVVNAA